MSEIAVKLFFADFPIVISDTSTSSRLMEPPRSWLSNAFGTVTSGGRSSLSGKSPKQSSQIVSRKSSPSKQPIRSTRSKSSDVCSGRVEAEWAMSLAMIICGPICVFLILAYVPRGGRVKMLVAMLTLMAAGAALYSGVRESCADGQSECMGATVTAGGVSLIWLLFLIFIFALVISQIRATRERGSQRPG